MTGKKEKGKLKTPSLTNDKIVSEEIHRNDSAQVSLSILNGNSPKKQANIPMPYCKYWFIFVGFSNFFPSAGATFIVKQMQRTGYDVDSGTPLKPIWQTQLIGTQWHTHC